MQNNRNDQIEQLHQSGKDYLLSPPPNPPQIKGPCPEDYRDVALHRIADQIGRLADATVLLARATAGEFEPGDEPQGEQYLDGTPR